MSEKLRHAAQVVLEHYLSCNPLRSADVHDARCGCMRCNMDYLSEALDAHATEASRVAKLEKAIEEAIILIDEINLRATSRKFHGISQALHAKLCTIRATAMRGTKP